MNVLVCITPQSNSKRLIDRGAEIVGNGTLHILHMQRGDDIFVNENTGLMLEELFNYGKTKDGVIHFISGNNFINELEGFTKENDIDHIVLGEPPRDTMTGDELIKRIHTQIPDMLISVVSQLVIDRV
jgi:K+-sensing histidine kinase KdpD